MQSHVDVIVKIQAPADVTTLRLFLGMVGYYAKSVARYAELAEIQRELLRKCESFRWTAAREDTFQRLSSYFSVSLFKCSTLSCRGRELTPEHTALELFYSRRKTETL